MVNVPITIAAGDYDRTRAIRDGRVTVDGCDVTYLTLRPEELFFRAVRYAEFDVCELSFSTYLMQTQRGDSAYIAIPVFLSRLFRHSGFYVRTDDDVNDADRLGRDPAMRWIVGGKAIERQAASTSQMGRFETELLATDEKLKPWST